MWLVGFRVTSLDNLNTSTHRVDEAGGIMFSGLLSICACINACVRSSMLTRQRHSPIGLLSIILGTSVTVVGCLVCTKAFCCGQLVAGCY